MGYHTIKEFEQASRIFIDNPIYDRTHKEFVNYCKCISERFKEA